MVVEGTISNSSTCPLTEGRVAPSPPVLGLCLLVGGIPVPDPDHQGGVTHLGGITRPAGAPPPREDGAGAGVLTTEEIGPTRVHRDAATQEAGRPMATPLLTTE